MELLEKEEEMKKRRRRIKTRLAHRERLHQKQN